MEISVLIEHLTGNGFRATCGEPFPSMALGATREEALAKIRAEIVNRSAGVEVVRMKIQPRANLSPIWPDDEITQDWLNGIAESRQEADSDPEAWDSADSP